MLGVCLVTLPPRAAANNNNNEVIAAATEVINGLTFETIYLTGSQAANLAQMQAHQNASKNYRYVLQADWTVTANPSGAHNDLFGNYVMIDLNGYTINGSLTFTCTTAEITDSSPRRTGTWTNESGLICNCWEQVTKLIISGGNLLNCHLAFALNNAAIQINGGNFTVDAGNKFFIEVYTNHNYTHAISFAPWVTPIYQNGTVMAFSSDDFFAVSTTDLVSGAYNYAYGYAWELTGGELNSLPIPTDKTYYLWGRNKNEWYHLLDVRYVDGICEQPYKQLYEQPLGGMTEWTKYSYGDNIELTNNTVTFNCQGGWEVLGLPVYVLANMDCILSVNVVAPNFETDGSHSGLFLGVSEQPPRNGAYENHIPMLARTEIAPNFQGQIELAFNSGEQGVVYIGLNGGYVADGQVITFTFNDWRLKTKNI